MACCPTCSMPTADLKGTSVCPHCDRRHYIRDCPVCQAMLQVDR